ncbi:MAG: hypothetical protein A3H69_02010 [Candidatus Sungbacteria bacterium RIFCSPLOWO2_02_FULL_47_9]|uniref:Carrier domain-containing protein n=1 Tax=Candidatus Sungbacteria bacterium RIFCSPHIGHO2_01_FULL_47_32 TaxID=1802264 RepID=A0A1G2K9N7_9BACT|nr:MAG: acyl carrier protein [Parcubacteria group bacterium GW2011_GWA2_47_10]OGZ95128.1 MAG: hypothetical protein A2633_06365 [Candidatus Sungbacteria bacterium RIFCSPHIGHO2_01_FULL_47_32]OGZ98201.1 MAG: hypothetical protein A3D57_03230 [Candidatus Sungbacteria bacterium RIFCSPHIGHO2_02_FULL_46_12]OHA05608.1 MAG: hypothetical protein A3A28_00360 [Candidatus Sungbacteria bacterium RIFCSPLOWO2_01_FULL_47_32]OHA12279.1 MAG: hypothetical protein A3H69_02010 [Candidatus Sungbacteria bacterium RIFCS
MKDAEVKLRKLLSDILKIAPDTITDDTSPETTESWDSFNGLMIAAELEKTYQVEFTMDEIITTKNVGDIKKNLRNHHIDI